LRRKAYNKHASHTKIIGLILGLIIVGAAGFFVYYIIAASPKPLGNKLEYIGKDSYGCWLVCDSNPSSVYYYATDMNAEEVVKYFKKAQIDNPEDIIQDKDAPISFTFSLSLPDTQRSLYIFYYNQGREYVRDSNFNLKVSSKRHLITIDSDDYTFAKDLL